MKKGVYIVVIIITIILGFSGYYFFYLENKSEETSHGPCLLDDEFAEYPIDEKYAEEIKYPKLPLVINIRDEKTQNIKSSFQIDNTSKAAHALETYKCSIYVIRVFNFDDEKGAPLPNYRTELWRFHYDGSGEKLIDLFKKEGVPDNYGQDFRIDPTETYLVLERSYLGNPNYAFVIKDLNTKEDVFVLTLDEILEQYPDVQPGSFGLGIFTPDNKYYWGDIYIGAYETAYYRIEMGTWKTDILPMPPDLPSGAERAWNFKGWLAYADIISFTGLEGVTEQIEEEAREEGKMKNLWIYNLFTKEKTKLASADPSWRFKPKWLSDTELEYYLPSGERKVYNIENK